MRIIAVCSELRAAHSPAIVESHFPTSFLRKSPLCCRHIAQELPPRFHGRPVAMSTIAGLESAAYSSGEEMSPDSLLRTWRPAERSLLVYRAAAVSGNITAALLRRALIDGPLRLAHRFVTSADLIQLVQRRVKEIFLYETIRMSHLWMTIAILTAAVGLALSSRPQPSPEQNAIQETARAFVEAYDNGQRGSRGCVVGRGRRIHCRPVDRERPGGDPAIVRGLLPCPSRLEDGSQNRFDPHAGSDRGHRARHGLGQQQPERAAQRERVHGRAREAGRRMADGERAGIGNADAAGRRRSAATRLACRRLGGVGRCRQGRGELRLDRQQELSPR